MEIELKLELAAEAAEKVATAAAFKTEPQITQLGATYYDTPDQDLRRNGFTLRVRKEGDRLVQTVKGTSKAAAGLFARPEWEQVVKTDAPVLDDSTPLRVLLGDRASRITRAFRVDVERRTWRLVDPDAVIEVALDKGTASAALRQAAIEELELEVKSGSLAGAFSLARRIADAAPLRLSVMAKSERGFRLLEAARDSFKAEPVELTTDMTAAMAFQTIIASCVRHYRLNEALLLQTHGSAALHQARVALRRLRAAFTIFKPLYDDERAVHLRDELKWLAGLLGEGRDIDVLIGSDDLPEHAEQLRKAGDEAYQEIFEALDSQRARLLVLDVVEWSILGDWLASDATADHRGKPAARFAVEPLDKFRKKVKKGGRDLQTIDDEHRHEVRKDAKKLRYSAEFFASLFSGKDEKRRHKKFVAALEALQEELGRLNDLAAAPQLINKLGLDEEAAADPSRISVRKEKIIAAAAEAHGDFVDAKRFWR